MDAESYAANEAAYVAFRVTQTSPRAAQVYAQMRSLRIVIQELRRYNEQYASYERLSLPELRREAGKNKTELIRCKGRLANLEKEYREHAAEDSFHDEYHGMCKVPRVLSVRAMQAAFDFILRIRTDVLYGKSRSGCWHRVGRFTIDAPLFGSVEDFRWRNNDGVMRTSTYRHQTLSEEMSGPAGIARDGCVSCLGTAKEPMSEALQKKKYVELVSMLVRYPECTGQYDNIVHWPRAEAGEVPQWYIDTFGK